jgi:hypothetical protein
MHPSMQQPPILILILSISFFLAAHLPYNRLKAQSTKRPLTLILSRVSSLPRATSGPHTLKISSVASSLPSLTVATCCDNIVSSWPTCPSPHNAENAIGAYPCIDQINFGWKIGVAHVWCKNRPFMGSQTESSNLNLCPSVATAHYSVSETDKIPKYEYKR